MPTIFSWEQFIEIAQFLVQETKKRDSDIPDEAAYRCAISRSYYAAFHIALDYAMDRFDYCPKRAGADHGELRDFMNHHGDAQSGRIAEKLTRLRNWRNQSDYDAPAYTINQNTAENAIRQAQEIVDITYTKKP